MIQLLKLVTVFLFGGITYYFLEVIFNGGSHVAMILCGGACIVFGDYVSRKSNINILKQSVIITFIILYIEYITGLITNVWLGLNIWDYSNLPLNINGQICLYFAIIWFLLSPTLIWFGGIIRWQYSKTIGWLSEKTNRQWSVEYVERPKTLLLHYWLLYDSLKAIFRIRFKRYKV